MRHALYFVLLVPFAGCGSCEGNEPRDSTRPPPLPEEIEPIAEPEPEPDPCVAADAALAAWDADTEVSIDELPAGAGGEPFGSDALVAVADEVYLGEDSAGPMEEAVAAFEDLPEDAFPEDAPILLALRATDPLSRITPLLRTFDEDTPFALVIVQADRDTGCRSVQQVTFGLKTDEDHGWVSFPTSRPVSDLLVALGGADQPRRVQLE